MKSSTVFLAVFLFVSVLGTSLHAEEFKGKWRNKTYNSSGGIKLVTPTGDQAVWNVKFVAEFQGKWRDYPAKIKATKKGSRIELEGTANIDGDSYTWSGYKDGDTLFGKFKSDSGNDGDFRMKRVK